MNGLQVFVSPDFGQIRAVEVNGEAWFVGKDVAKALGYGNPRQALKTNVDDEDKGVHQMDTLKGNQAMNIINESGLYSLIMSSKLPGAKKFKRWVTSEVLPSIRKHGAYLTNDVIEQILADPETVIHLATSLKSEREKCKALQMELEQNRPKIVFSDSVSVSSTSILVGELAKLLKQNGINMGQNRLFQWMRNNGYLIRRHGADHNMPTQKSMELGLFEIKETAITHSDGNITLNKTPKVTGKGQRYFIGLFLSEKAGLGGAEK